MQTESEGPIRVSLLPYHVVLGGLRSRPISLCGLELEADKVLHFLTQRTRPRGFPSQVEGQVLLRTAVPRVSRGARPGAAQSRGLLHLQGQGNGLVPEAQLRVRSGLHPAG